MTSDELTPYCFDLDDLKCICPIAEDPQMSLSKLSSLIREQESLFEILFVKFCRETVVNHDHGSLDDLNEDILNSNQPISDSEIGVSMDKVQHPDDTIIHKH
jgi:hypothetical protein